MSHEYLNTVKLLQNVQISQTIVPFPCDNLIFLHTFGKLRQVSTYTYYYFAGLTAGCIFRQFYFHTVAEMLLRRESFTVIIATNMIKCFEAAIYLQRLESLSALVRIQSLESSEGFLVENMTFE